ncbi:DUF2515 family protein [Gorillibacterium sp. CAU 1737]|uniref:DUF2515 family protein n=1 Tax=Gorillibacterium sp. CAU 1737 TaxID=3140362 RepID=UPI0032606BC1
MNVLRRLAASLSIWRKMPFFRPHSHAAASSPAPSAKKPLSDKQKNTRVPLLSLTPSAAERVRDKLRAVLQTTQALRLEMRERADRLERAQALDPNRYAVEAAAELAEGVLPAGEVQGASQGEAVWEGGTVHEGGAVSSIEKTLDLSSSSRDRSLFPIRASLGPLPAGSPAEADASILRWVVEETRRMNRSNVTRTYAYYRLYLRHPELHWAFLAHLVSRNAGWNMTDLKGSLVSRLINARLTEAMFQMLERANALIFQDAYPQLLLYQEGKRRGRPLHALLRQLPVSSFMPPLWEDFAVTGDPVPLAIGLIINEQQYIQGRVVENPFFEKEVLDDGFFHLGALLHTNQVLFPFLEEGGDRLHLAGLTLEDFPDVDERIRFGRKLYALLFGVPAVQAGCRRFAERTPHTGSRADYWPQRFTNVKEASPPLSKGEMPPVESPKLYSPTLADAWSTRPIEPAVPGDWFRDMSPLKHFSALKPPASWIMDREHQLLIQAQEAAVLAKTWANPRA